MISHSNTSNINKSNANKSRGFTLVEIMVALGIFAIVAVVAVGAFLKIVDANKKSQTLKTAINNINFALESVSREMRVGSSYSCGSGQFTQSTITETVGDTDPCSIDDQNPTGAYIAFVSSRADDVCNLINAYWFSPNPTEGWTLEKAEQIACGVDVSTSDYSPVISPDAVIDHFTIKISPRFSGSDPAQPPVQPSALIRIKGHTGIREISKTVYDVQTTISQRSAI